MRHLILILLLLSSLKFIAQQNLEQGFQFLESGNFEKAEIFFKNILENDPNNKTARICLGRAIGLNGRASEGFVIFNDLLIDHPEDFEVQLNLAEALMWQKRYAEAKDLYSKLLGEDPNNFTANLGYANATSSLKEYELALEYINKCISMNPGYDGAILSKKYILLGLADRKRRNWKFKDAEKDLDAILEFYPDDREALINKAIVFLSNQEIRDAKKTYQYLYDREIDGLEGLLGLSYTQLLLNDKKNALSTSRNAVQQLAKMDADTATIIRTEMNAFFMLAVNRKFKEAEKIIDRLENSYGNSQELELSRARLLLLKGNFSESEYEFSKLLETYPESFVLDMGYAEILRARKKIDGAKSYIGKALVLDPNQPDAIRLLQELELDDRPSLEIGGSFSEDNAQNEGENLNVKLNFGRFSKLKPYVLLELRKARQVDISPEADIRKVQLGGAIDVNEALSFNLSGGLSALSSSVTELSESRLIGVAGLNFRTRVFHTIGLEVKREMHNYTADLIRNLIAMNHITITYNLYLPSRIGLFSQLIYTNQSDENTRKLFYSSLYYDIKSFPLIKIGASFSLFGFDNTEVIEYFSPSSYSAFEAFTNFSNQQDAKSKFLYNILLAFGTQKIEEESNQSIRRVELGAGFRFAKNFELGAYYRTSNAAQTTVTGFSSSIIGLNLTYRIPVNMKLVETL